jgi:hypothetical protein
MEITNHLDKPVRIIVNPRPVKNVKSLSLMRVGSINFDIIGSYQKQELMLTSKSSKK